MLKCISCPSLEILTRIGGEKWFGQTQNGVNFEFEVKFDLEGQGPLPKKNNRDLNQGVLLLWTKFGDPSLNG